MILDSKILNPYLHLEIVVNVHFFTGSSMQIIINQNICITKDTISMYEQKDFIFIFKIDKRNDDYFGILSLKSKLVH